MRRGSSLVVVLAIAFLSASPAGADDPAEEKATVDARIAALQSDIASSKAEEGVLTSQLSAVTAELRAAQSAVDSAQAGLDAFEAELAAASSRLERLTVLLGQQTDRLHRLQAEYAKAVEILEARVRAAYIDGPPDVLSFVVSASSFDEIIDSVEYVNRVGRQDKRIATQVELAKIRTARERRATAATRRRQAETVSVISARTDQARAARDEIAANRDRLAAVESLKESAVADTRESREEYLAEVEALAAESASLAARIQAAQQAASAGSTTGSAGTGQPSAAGFVWPCDGVVVSGFGLRWGRMHEGVDIGCAYGTPNRASAAGTVIVAGWHGGYGNLVVVDHGDGLATAYAHGSAIVVGVGQSVSQGQTVSLVGSTGNSSGPHLHFEVRVNGSAVDPLWYL